MNNLEIQKFLKKYNLKVNYKNHNWFPLPLCKQGIELCSVNKYFNTATPEEEFKITFPKKIGGYIELYKYNSCCDYFETTVEPLYKTLLAEKKIQQAQEDFE